MPKAEKIEAGKLINTHGITGEMKAEVWLDSPQFMKTFRRFFIGEKEYLNTAMLLKGCVLKIAREDAHLPAGAFFLCDIIGARVIDERGVEIGILTDIEENPAAPIYIVKGEREHLIPGVPEFIRQVDAEHGLVTVRLIEGM